MQWVALIAVAVAALDQLTKWLVVRFVGPEESRVVINGFFNLVNWGNTGAAWGIFQNNNLFLATISLLTILALYLFRRSFQLRHWGSRITLGLIVGGIIGNLIDRIRIGYVIDFLSFYVGPYHFRSHSVGPYHWPAFNVADSSICIGVGLYIILSWRSDAAARKGQQAIPSQTSAPVP